MCSLFLLKKWGKHMLAEPQKKISERALTVWRITSALYAVIILMFVIAIIIVSVLFTFPAWISGIAVLVFILFSYFFIYLFPLLRWRRWRYDVRAEEIELQNGVFIKKRTLIPMIRVQHVDTKQGPILSKYKLATVTVSTAATIHEIPALELTEAEELRTYISRLARVADDDV